MLCHNFSLTPLPLTDNIDKILKDKSDDSAYDQLNEKYSRRKLTKNIEITTHSPKDLAIGYVSIYNPSISNLTSDSNAFL